MASMTIQSPVRLTLVLAATTFVAETIIMFALPLLGFPSTFAHNVLDAFLLTILIAPAIYFTLFRSLTRQILESRRAEQALRESEQRFREMLQTVRLLSVMIDRKGEILFCNDFLLCVTGWNREDVVGKNWFDLFVPNDSHSGQSLAHALKHGTIPGHCECEILTRSGDRRLVVWNNTPLRNAQSEIIGNASLGEDITERKQLENQFRQAQKLEAIGQLAGGVAHDFNNILTVIQGNAAFLKRPGMSAEHRTEALDEIRLAVRRGADLTRQLLAFSRRQEIVRRTLDLKKVLSGLTKMLGRLIGEHITLNYQYSSGDVYIHGDEGMIEQIVANLVVNARDAMPDGGHLTIATKPVQIDDNRAKVNPAAYCGDFVRLTVTDTGTGIPQKDLPRIFEPFFTTKEAGKGSGLGLSTVFGIVHQHDGWIEVASEPGVGTRFDIYLPRLQTPDVTQPKKPKSPKARRGSETILLVEDNDGVRSVARRALTSYGYSVFEAVSSKDAFWIWKKHSDTIQLLLTDMLVPGGMSGIELSEILRTEKPSLKTIYASGFRPDFIPPAVQLIRGVNFIEKPYHPDRLAELIRRQLDNPQRPSPLLENPATLSEIPATAEAIPTAEH